MFKNLILLVAFVTTTLAFDINSNSNLAVYWGQNSAGTQTRLKNYCDQDIDIVLLSFLTSFPDNLQVDFSNMCSDTFSNGLRKCDQIGEDIQYCQDKGIIVLLSMGGSSGSYGFTDDNQATTFATTLWNKFGGGSDDERPFGDAVVDGFDFDLENNDQTGTVALGKGLRQKFEKDTSKKYYLSAAPQCPYPDASVGNFLSEVNVDLAFIQFYNNYCNLGTTYFNWDTWQDYATNASPNKDIKLYVGQPGGVSGAGSGYNPASTVKEVVDNIKLSNNFGGISLWDASQAVSNVNDGESYLQQMKSILGSTGGSKAVVTDTSSSSSTSSSKTSFTTIKDSTTGTIQVSSTATSTKSSTKITSSSSSSSTTPPVKVKDTSDTSVTTKPVTKSSDVGIRSSSSSVNAPSDLTTTISINPSNSDSSTSSTTFETPSISEIFDSGHVVTESVIKTQHNSIFTTKTTHITPNILTLTNIHTPTTITTIRITGTTTEIATKYVEPPNM